MVSYSIRAKLVQSGRLASFVYGYPYNSTAEFHFYFGSLNLPTEVAQPLRQKLLSYGVFKESGQKTLAATLKEGNDLSRFYNVYESILEEINVIKQEF